MASLNDADDDLHGDGDYYATLGLARNATKEEINNAYRHYSKLYHPDKHQAPEKKVKAEKLFNKIKKAHEVLSDPRRRAIYDVAGHGGLNADGWELQTRYKTPQEIILEYEQLKKEMEERLLQKRTNPKGSVTVGINATDIFEQYIPEDTYYGSSLPNVEISNMRIHQSVECPLTTKETLTLSGELSSSNGKGEGNVKASLRKVFDHKNWGEIDLGLGSNPSFGARYFRTLWNHCQVGAGLNVQTAPNGSMGIFYNIGLSKQFYEHLHGRINLQAGALTGMEVVALYNKKSHHAAVAAQMGIPFSSVMFSYSYFSQETKNRYKTILRLATNGVMLELGYDREVTKFSRLGAAIVMGVPSGVKIKLKLARGDQTFYVPIHLSESFMPSAALYGSLVTILAYSLAKKYVFDPYFKNQAEKEISEKRKKHTELFEMKKHEAAASLDLMEESIERSYEIERERRGLVIVGALYGADVNVLSGCTEVSRCLQAMVKNSQLSISETINLFDLPGFYDPCFGEQKHLLVEYDFNERRHQHVFKEGDRIVLPDAGHLLS